MHQRSPCSYLQRICTWIAVASALAPVATACGAAPEVGAAWSVQDYDARETRNGLLFNREHGQLQGQSFEFAGTFKVGRIAISAAHEGGNITYQGVTQLAIPIVSITDLDIQRVAMRWTPAWHPAIGRVSVETHTELAHQSIERGIRRSPLSLPLTENLQSLWLRSGATAQLPLGPRWHAQAEGQVSWPLDQQLRVNSFGVYDPFSLKPHARVSTHAGVSLFWQPVDGLHLSLHANRDFWHYGHSDSRDITRGGTLAGSADYPGSRQHLQGFAMRLQRTF